MKDRWRHFPFVLVLYFVLTLGAMTFALNLDQRLLVTLLAPLLWLGLYTLGAERA